jgi:hypothetical protein
MKWTGYVARNGENINMCEVWYEILNERKHLSDRCRWKGNVVRIVFVEYGGRSWTGFIWLRIQSSDESLWTL